MLSVRTNTDYSAHVIHGEYRPHIDGIRALAVLPVVAFHILAALCPGGFAGVDVFFVISGYLITGGILRDLAQDRFTIRGFYHRRIRRILPAYFVLIAGVFTVGCLLYYATPLVFLGDAVAASTLFLANFHFWMLGGDYFAPELHSQALLHLWSLSVEEQFYLFIPLLCAILWKVRRRAVMPVVAGVALLSFAAATLAVVKGRQPQAFFLLHDRAWELLAGALLAMIPAAVAGRQDDARARTWDARPGFLAVAGLLLVLAPYALLTSRTPFPGLAALPSVVGTALLIRHGQNGWISRVLAWRPFVLTGKMSYSLYLWHWPVTVFWRYATFDQLYAFDYLGMLVLSFLLAYLSWRLVEIPVRASPVWTLRRTFAAATAGIILLVALGTLCAAQKGWPWLHPRANALAWVLQREPFVHARVNGAWRRARAWMGCPAAASDPSAPVAPGLMFSQWGKADEPMGVGGEPELLLIGDSHAGALQPGLDAKLRDAGRRGWVVCQSGTWMFDLTSDSGRDVIARLQVHPGIRRVVLAQYWSAYADRNRDRYRLLEQFARRLGEMQRTLYVLTDIPVRGASPDRMARMQIIRPRRVDAAWAGGQSRAEYERMQGGINTRLAEVCRATGAVLIPQQEAFMRGDTFAVTHEQEGRMVLFYRDEDHLSPPGALQSAQFILPRLFAEGVPAPAQVN